MKGSQRQALTRVFICLTLQPAFAAILYVRKLRNEYIR